MVGRGWRGVGGEIPRFGARFGVCGIVSRGLAGLVESEKGVKTYREICCSSSSILAALAMFLGLGRGGWGEGAVSS